MVVLVSTNGGLHLMKRIRGFKKKHEKHLVFQRSLRLFSNNSFHKSIVFAVAVLFVLLICMTNGIMVSS